MSETKVVTVTEADIREAYNNILSQKGGYTPSTGCVMAVIGRREFGPNIACGFNTILVYEEDGKTLKEEWDGGKHMSVITSIFDTEALYHTMSAEKMVEKLEGRSLELTRRQ